MEGVLPFIHVEAVSRAQWSELLSSLRAVLKVVTFSGGKPSTRFLQGLLRETRVLDALCALIKFPFEGTQLEYTQLKPRAPLASAIRYCYGSIKEIVEVR